MKKRALQMEQEYKFSHILRDYRLKAGLSQGDVSKKLGYTSPQFISNWERGLSVPPVETLPVLANLYSISLESFLENYIQFRVQNLEAEIRSKLPKAHLKKVG